ncbi:MAG: chorismate synthase [Candidatus Promineifilaceae bacterium]|nr:chorismate synthase [Candidatus Promineifilaceae bacterium]
MEILGGPLFAVAGAGESHGPGITTIVFGCPAGLQLSRPQIQTYLDRRRPGSSRHGTPRQEKDRLVILSGLYAGDHEQLTAGPAIEITDGDIISHSQSYETGFTTGEPIAAVVLSTAKKSRHYRQFEGPQGAVRPGHTDLVKYYKSRGFIDIRGGGRSSYRSTISDVIGGSIARIFLRQTFGTVLLSSISAVGPLQSKITLSDTLSALLAASGGQKLTSEDIETLQKKLSAAEIHTLDQEFAQQAADLIKKTRIAGDSLGAAVEVVAVNVPALAGDPLYQSLKIRLMGVLGGLNAAQSCEIGDGVRVISRLGSENNDPIRRAGYQSNSHGGLIGGVTTGMPLVSRVGFKPTSTIVKSQESVRKNLEEMDFMLEKGRHDPCVGIRAGITLESRMAIELLNAVLMHQASSVDARHFNLF